MAVTASAVPGRSDPTLAEFDPSDKVTEFEPYERMEAVAGCWTTREANGYGRFETNEEEALTLKP